MRDARRAASSERLRISYLLQQFPVPTETFAISDIAALIAQGHDVTVYTMKRAPRDEQRLCEMCRVPAQVPILRPSLKGAASWPMLLWRKRGQARRLLQRIAKSGRSAPIAALQAILCVPRLLEIAEHVGTHDYDVTHSFWARHVGLVLPILEMQGSSPLRSAFVGAYDLVADDFLVEMTVDSAEVVFSHAEANRPFLERKAHDAPIEIIHRGIPLAEIGDEQDRDPFRWITASALVPSKNVETVIRVFAKHHVREQRLRLDVYGSGPDRARLKRIVHELGCSDAVTFAGHIARDELTEHMRQAAVFLLLSKKPSERLPNVLKEALWAGCVVVSSNSEGIEELIPDSSIGFVVDPDDANALDAALSAVLSETPEQSVARRNAARGLVAGRFSSEGSMLRYVAAWRSALRLRGPETARAAVRE